MDDREPTEEELADKPAVDDVEETTELPGDEEVAEGDFMNPGDAAADDSVDDSESQKYDGGAIPQAAPSEPSESDAA